MDTLQDIINERDKGTGFASGVDTITPAGHFQVTAVILGQARIYLLEGDEGNLESTIKGIVVISKDNNRSDVAYRSNSLLGGNMIGPISSSSEGYKKAFATMAT